MFTEQRKGFAAVCRITQFGNCRVHFFLQGFFLHLFLISNLATYQHINCQADHRRHRCNASKMNNDSNQEANRKSSSRRNKPSADNRQHTGNTVNRTFPSPGTVGQRTAHCHHKCHVSRRKRQLQRSTQRNQQSRKYHINRSTDQVKAGFVFQNNFIIIKTAVNPVLYFRRNHTQNRTGSIIASADQHTCHR